MSEQETTTDPGYKQTSIRVKEDIWADFRIQVIRRNTNISDAIAEAISQWTKFGKE